MGQDRAGQVFAQLGLDVELALGWRQRGLALEFAERAALWHVGVRRRAAAGRARSGFTAAASPSAAAAAGERDAEDRRLVEVERHGVIVAVGDRAAFVLHSRAEDRAVCLKLARLR